MLVARCTVRRLGAAAGLLTLGFAAPTRGSAQIAPAPIEGFVRRTDPCAPGKSTKRVNYIVAPYGWLLGIHGENGVRDLTADVNIRFSDLLSKLRWGAMGTFEISYGNWLGIADGLYASVHQNNTPSVGNVTANIDFNLNAGITQYFAGYTYRARPNLAVDVLAGARVWAFDASLRLQGQNVARERERNPTWVDALGGLRVRWEPAKQWHVNLEGDGGGGGSKGTGEGIGTVGYTFATHWDAFLAYRYLYLNYRKNDFFFTGHYAGPAIGAAYRFY